MKQPEKREVLNKRPSVDRVFQIHPVPPAGEAIVSVTTHLLQQFAATQGKEPPGLSLNAASFLTAQRWEAGELARRVWRAVEINRGSLITAADLGEP
jgi:DNA-binding NtrC family response regulator